MCTSFYNKSRRLQSQFLNPPPRLCFMPCSGTVSAMTASRVPETNGTTSGRGYTEAYDQMQATLWRQGWLETGDLLLEGIAGGSTLEVGSGPGYLGLDWLLRTKDTVLVGLDINPDMVGLAVRHARELGLADRARHVLGSAAALPFDDNAYDAVVASRSLHEWLDPGLVFTELWRVLKPGGRVFVSDLRRDLSPKACAFLETCVTSDVVRESFRASVAAAYTRTEVAAIIASTGLAGWAVAETALGLRVTGVKPT
jgi:ubiquinone/menaquinone biosynthesis C-methylase UbiE